MFDLFKEVASTRRLEEDFNTDKRVAGLDDITPAKVFIINLMNIIMIIIVVKIFILRWFCTWQMARRFLASHSQTAWRQKM